MFLGPFRAQKSNEFIKHKLHRKIILTDDAFVETRLAKEDQNCRNYFDKH